MLKSLFWGAKIAQQHCDFEKNRVPFWGCAMFLPCSSHVYCHVDHVLESKRTLELRREEILRTQINSIGTDRPDPAMLISCLLPCGALFGQQNDTVASQRGKFESRNQLNRARSDRSCHVDLMRGSPTEHHEPKGAPQFTTPIPIADASPAGVSSTTDVWMLS